MKIRSIIKMECYSIIIDEPNEEQQDYIKRHCFYRIEHSEKVWRVCAELPHLNVLLAMEQ